MKIPIYNADESPHGDERDQAAADEQSESSAPMTEPNIPAAAAEDSPTTGPVQALEAALAEKTQECEAMRQQLLRLMADFDNYRKRMNRQYEEARQFAMTDLILVLLPGFDNLERALSAARQDTAPGSAAIAEGVAMVLKQFKDALAKVGVREVQTQGQPFDPTRHEAVDTAGVAASDDGRIVQEVQRGYMLNDRLIRPAKVIVGKAEHHADQGGA